MQFKLDKRAALAFVLLASACAPRGDHADASFEERMYQATHGDARNLIPEDGATQTTRAAVSQDAGFADALRAATLRNDGVTASIARFRQANARVGVAESGRRPQVRGSVTTGGIIEDNNRSLGAFGDISLVQLLFDGGQTAANIDAASARAFAAKADVASTANTVGREAANAWIEVWQYSNQLSLLRTRVAEIEPWIARIERLINTGVVNRNVLAAAERQLLTVQLQEQSIEASLRAANERFRRYYGFTPTRVAEVPVLFSEQDLVSLRNSWQSAPALVATAAELVAAQSDVTAARAESRPNVSLTTGVNAPLTDRSTPRLTAGIQIQHDFFDGGRRSSELQEREERLASLAADFEDTKIASEADLEAALARYRATRSSLSVIGQQIEVIRQENESLASQLSSGQANVQELVEAEIRLYQAQSQRIELIATQRRLEMEITALTGRLSERLQIDVDGLI